MLLNGFYGEDLANAIAGAAGIFPVGVGAEMKIILFQNNPTLTPQTQIADLVEADFDGYAAVGCGAGSVQTASNPVTGQWQIRPREPAGGFQFISDFGILAPQTIFGFALTNFGKTFLIASAKFLDPIQLTTGLQVIDVPQPILNLALSPLT